MALFGMYTAAVTLTIKIVACLLAVVVGFLMVDNFRPFTRPVAGGAFQQGLKMFFFVFTLMPLIMIARMAGREVHYLFLIGCVFAILKRPTED